MTIPVHRHRALRGEELIGHVVDRDGGWAAWAPASDASLTYASAAEAEAALRHDDDQARGRRVIAGAFIALMAAHPVLLIASQLF